jgi:excisionase family DNA binding protein
MTEQQWAVSPSEAAELLGLNRRTFYRQVMPYVYSGVIRSGKIGRARRIDVQSLRAWWDKQMGYTSGA